MKKFTTVLLISIITILGCNAQKSSEVVKVNDIFKTITYRYITFKNETKDSKALERFYTPIFKAYGYKHELPGDGYGGPCSIIDGFYKGGYVNKKKHNIFVPTNKKTASVIFMSACNDGEDGDYGYMQVTLTVYSESVAKGVIADLESSGFTLFEFDNPEEAGDILLYYNGDKQVHVDYNEYEKAFNFQFSIAQ